MSFIFYNLHLCEIKLLAFELGRKKYLTNFNLFSNFGGRIYNMGNKDKRASKYAQRRTKEQEDENHQKMLARYYLRLGTHAQSFFQCI